MNTAEHHVRARRTSGRADFVTAQRIAGMDADTNDIAGGDGGRVERVQRLVNQAGFAKVGGGRRCKDVEPTGCNDANSERDVTRIDEINGHRRQRTATGATSFTASMVAANRRGNTASKQPGVLEEGGRRARYVKNVPGG